MNSEKEKVNKSAESEGFLPDAAQRSVKRRRKTLRIRIVSVLAAIVVFVTTYALVLPAITQSAAVFCGYEEHTHSEKCYEDVPVLICGFAPEAVSAAHEHTDECVSVEKTCICGLEETEGHAHTEDCYEKQTVCVCGLEENEEHTHSETCYEEQDVLICELTECEPHSHTDECFEENTVYTCGFDAEKEETSEAAHVHTEECYRYERTLVCGLEEHTHSLACYSDPEADAEGEADWKRTFSKVEFSGDYRSDVVALAKTQLGYEASEKNYAVAEDNETKLGYTRYGAWYGDKYARWDTLFVDFCLTYAGCENSAVYFDADCGKWARNLAENNKLGDAAYKPVPGDLLFLDTVDEDPETKENEKTKLADKVSVIVEINDNGDSGIEYKVIEGWYEGKVKYNTYSASDPAFFGYGIMPEMTSADKGLPSDDEDIPENDANTLVSAPASDGAVAVVTGEIPEGAEVFITAIELSYDEMVAYFGEEKAQSVNNFVAYDITIKVNGEEWQPDNSVDVTVKHPDLEVSDDEKIGVAHVKDADTVEFPEQTTAAEEVFSIEAASAETYEVTAEAETVTETAVEEVDVTRAENGEVEFTTDGFSLYILYTYTVDFHYGDVTYSIAGTSSIYLADLFEILGIDLDANTAIAVTFSDPSLIEVSQDENGWLLTSLAPFATTELLTVDFGDDNVLYINVTDANTGTSKTLLRAGQFTTANVNGKTVYLGTDITVGTTVNISSNTVIDLNGHKIEATCNPLFNVTGGTLTIRDSAHSTVVSSVASGDVYGRLATNGSYTHSRIPLTGTSATAAGSSGQGYDKLFDNNYESGSGKYRAQVGNDVNNIDVYFRADSAETATRLALVSADDTASNPNRIPSGFTLYGSNDQNTWTTLLDVDDPVMAADNYTGYTYSIDNPGSYRYYKISFDVSQSHYMQLAEVRLFSTANPGLTYYVTESTVTDPATGATTETLIKNEVYSGGIIRGNGSNRFINQSGGTVNLEGGYVHNFAQTNGRGGAVNISGGTFNLDGGVIAGNTALRGGAIQCTGSSKVNIKSGAIAGNHATEHTDAREGSADHSGGGGIYSEGTSVITQTGGYLTNNVSDASGYFEGGGGALLSDTSSYIIQGGYLTGNKSCSGGAIRTDWNNKAYVEMTGGFVCSNIASSAEGGGICINNADATALILGGYVNNNETWCEQHWGGGGLFCANGGKMYLRGALITNNDAGGYGGGVAGCSTGRVYLTVDEGAAIYGNTAAGENLSGTASAKPDDREYAAKNTVFIENGADDFFCCLNSIVTGSMLGGGTANWTGSADNVPVASNDPYDVLEATSIMGLNGNPEDSSIIAAENFARLYINGNYSHTHGGGVLCNGYLVVGEPDKIDVYARISLNADKSLIGENGQNITLKDGEFWFTVVDENGLEVSRGKSETDGNIYFDRRIACKKAGTYSYYITEDTPEEGGVIRDTTIYKLDVTVTKTTDKLTEDIDRNTYKITHIKLSYSKDGGSTWTTRSDSSVSSAEDAPYGVTIGTGSKTTFVNYKASKTDLTVHKDWASGSTSQPITCILYRNEQEQQRFTLSSSNNWTKTFTDLPLADSNGNTYTYSVMEEIVPGYLAEYKYVNDISEDTYFVPVTSLDVGGQYVIVNNDGNKALYVTEDHYNSGFTSADTRDVTVRTGTLRVGNATYSKWINGADVNARSIFTAMRSTTNNNSRILLKNNGTSANSWLLVQDNNGNYLKGCANEQYSSGFLFSNGYLQGQNNWDSGNTWRYMQYTNDKFTTTTSTSAGSRLTNIYKMVSASATMASSIYITNVPISQVEFTLQLEKKGEGPNGEKTLPNAVFGMFDENRVPLYFTKDEEGNYRYASSTDPGATSELMTNLNGDLNIFGIPYGTYTVKETDAPPGFGVVEDQVVTFDESTITKKITYTVVDPQISVYIPATGGTGTQLYTIGGAALIALSLLYGYNVIQRKKKDRGLSL